MRLTILGNSGSGKSTLARRLVACTGVEALCLDGVAWDPGPVRRDHASALAELRAFTGPRDAWIVEGCYGDLIEAILPEATGLVLLDPGVEACLEHCRRRPFEADKFASPEAQQAMLEPLLDWVRAYPDRAGDLGRARHQEIFEAFAGPKQHLTRAAELTSSEAITMAAALGGRAVADEVVDARRRGS